MRLSGQATNEMAFGSKLVHGGGFKRPWPPPIKMDTAVKAKVEKVFDLNRGSE